MTGPASGVPTFGFYDRNSGSAGADEPDQFMLYDNIVVTQNGPTTNFTATSGNFSDPSNWSARRAGGNWPGCGLRRCRRCGKPQRQFTRHASFAGLQQQQFLHGWRDQHDQPGCRDRRSDQQCRAHLVNAPVNISGNVSVFNHEGSTLTLTKLTTNPAKFFSKTGAGTLEVNQVRAAGMTITDGFVRLLPNGATSKVER